MHRHSYKGRKFGREKDQRVALRRALMCALFEYQTITTTLARAKEIRREAEKLITIARKGGLANRRLVIARLNSPEMGALLCDVIAPQMERDSGYLRIEHSGYRKGDNAEMGTISFVDDIDLDFELVSSADGSASADSDRKSGKSAKIAEKVEETVKNAEKSEKFTQSSEKNAEKVEKTAKNDKKEAKKPEKEDK